MNYPAGLHPTAQAIYKFVVAYKMRTAGESPTRREIAEGVDLPSLSMVQHHLVRLERAGLITLPATGKARRIGIPGAVWQVGGAGD